MKKKGIFNVPPCPLDFAPILQSDYTMTPVPAQMIGQVADQCAMTNAGPGVWTGITPQPYVQSGIPFIGHVSCQLFYDASTCSYEIAGQFVSQFGGLLVDAFVFGVYSGPINFFVPPAIAGVTNPQMQATLGGHT